jgi:hypothetical protein
MKYEDVTKYIIEICSDEKIDFQSKGNMIEKRVRVCSKKEILNHLDNAGIIPESFGHDSTEEKVFAKYCDILLARSLTELGLDARLIAERADSADVLASGSGYAIVGDAKAFRLSRTAKNQKDFKVEALDSWRKGADYACLICPLYQYPIRTSQIYLQAIRYNVTLLSYNHLAFLVRYKGKKDSLKPLWESPKTLEIKKSADKYWQGIETAIINITGKTESDIQQAKSNAMDRLPYLAEEQIRILEEEKEKIRNMPHEKAVKELIVALKIDAKIAVIRRAAGI